MATKTSQRVFIWVIAIVMTIGTIAGFVAMILAPGNERADSDRLNALYAEYQAELEAHQVKLDEQAKTMSERYFEAFKPYSDRVATFDGSNIETLAINDLKTGDGKQLADDAEYAVYYIGWNPAGKMFDSSFNDDKTSLNRPLVHMTDGMWDFGSGTPGSVIEGWTEGLEGIKMGGVRELTIPADKAYGETGQGEDIPANTPLKFIMMVVEAPDTIEAPQMSAELQRLLQAAYQ